MRINLSGKQFGKWTVIRRSAKKDHYLCRCECGVERDVYEFHLKDGSSTKCTKCSKYRHGHSRPSRTYTTWMCMRRRCSDPTFNDYDRYGGSGVKICERWESFELFLEDMGERPDGKIIDRIDVLGNYEPLNCRWVTPKESAANRRKPRTVCTQ